MFVALSLLRSQPTAFTEWPIFKGAQAFVIGGAMGGAMGLFQYSTSFASRENYDADANWRTQFRQSAKVCVTANACVSLFALRALGCLCVGIGWDVLIFEAAYVCAHPGGQEMTTTVKWWARTGAIFGAWITFFQCTLDKVLNTMSSKCACA